MSLRPWSGCHQFLRGETLLKTRGRLLLRESRAFRADIFSHLIHPVSGLSPIEFAYPPTMSEETSTPEQSPAQEFPRLVSRAMLEAAKMQDLEERARELSQRTKLPQEDSAEAGGAIT